MLLTEQSTDIEYINTIYYVKSNNKKIMETLYSKDPFVIIS